jgi:hypothetical protein
LRHENDDLKKKLDFALYENSELRKNMYSGLKTSFSNVFLRKETIEVEIGDQKAQIQGVIEQYKRYFIRF